MFNTRSKKVQVLTNKNKRWPANFSELLSQTGNDILESGINARQFDMDNNETPYAAFQNVLAPDKSDMCLELLEKHWLVMKEHKQFNQLRHEAQIDPEIDYNSSPFSCAHYQMTCQINGAKNEVEQQFFENTGLLQMAKSASMKEFAEKVTGYELVQNERNGVSVICYEPRGYISPHSDVKWPLSAGWENVAQPIAYVDLHLAFSTEGVESQHLVLQQGDFLNGVRGGKPVNGTVGVYRMPFWHYTTPMVAKVGLENQARRWVLMFNYELVGDKRPKRLSKGGFNGLDRFSRDGEEFLNNKP